MQKKNKKTKGGGGLWAVVVASVGILGVGCKQTNDSINWVGWFCFVFDKEKTRKKRVEIHIHTHN